MLEDAEDRESFCSSCKALRCEAVRSSFKCIYLDCTAVPDAVQGLARFSSFAPGLQELSIQVGSRENLDYSTWLRKDGLQIIRVLQACQEHTSTGAAARLSLTKITCLTIRDCNCQSTSESLAHAAVLLKTLCPRLSEVRLETVFVDDTSLKYFMGPLQLKTLKLSPIDPSKALLSGLAQLTMLTHLCLDLVGDEAGKLSNVAELSKLHQLQHLELENSFCDKVVGLDEVLKHCQQLKVLRLYDMPDCPLPGSPSLEHLTIEELTTDDLPKLMRAVQDNCSLECHILKLSIRPIAYSMSTTKLKTAASQLAGCQAVKWDKCATVLLDQEDCSLGDHERDYVESHEKNEGTYSWDSFDEEEEQEAKMKHEALMKSLGAVEPLGHALQGSVTSLHVMYVRLEEHNMSRLARMVGPSVQRIYFEDCMLAPTTLAEAVQALPSLQHVRVANLGRTSNYHAVVNGMDAKKSQQERRQLLQVLLEPGVWESGRVFGRKGHFDKEQACIKEVVTKSRLREFTGKVEVSALPVPPRRSCVIVSGAEEADPAEVM